MLTPGKCECSCALRGCWSGGSGSHTTLLFRRFRIDNIGDDFFQDLATFDTFLGLGERQESGAHEADDSDSGTEADAASTSRSGKGVGGFFKSVFGRKKKAGKESGDKKRANEGFVRVHTHKKGVKELTKVMLCQHLHVHTGPVWTMKFSHDGQYLATAGQDTSVLVWKVSMFSSESDGDSTVSGGSLTANPGSHLHAGARVPTLAQATQQRPRAGRTHTTSVASTASSTSGGAPSVSSGATATAAGAGRGAPAAAAASATSDGIPCKGTPLFDAAPIRTYRGHSVRWFSLSLSLRLFLYVSCAIGVLSTGPVP